MQGDQSVKLLHCSYLPLAMSVLPDPDYFFNNPLVDYDLLYGQGAREVYSEAKVVTLERARQRATTGEISGSAIFLPTCERGTGSIISSDAAPAAMSCGWDFPARRSPRTCRSFPRALTRKGIAMVRAT